MYLTKTHLSNIKISYIFKRYFPMATLSKTFIFRVKHRFLVDELKNKNYTNPLV